jgi:hypothetical protein
VKPYNPDAKCLKCGSDDIASIWNEKDNCREDDEGPKSEHIMRVCTRCHFEWPEKPLPTAKDSDPEPAPNLELRQQVAEALPKPWIDLEVLEPWSDEIFGRQSLDDMRTIVPHFEFSLDAAMAGAREKWPDGIFQLTLYPNRQATLAVWTAEYGRLIQGTTSPGNDSLGALAICNAIVNAKGKP